MGSVKTTRRHEFPQSVQWIHLTREKTEKVAGRKFAAADRTAVSLPCSRWGVKLQGTFTRRQETRWPGTFRRRIPRGPESRPFLTEQEPKLFKDELGAAAVESLARALHQVRGDFPAGTFTDESLDGLEALELKDRVRHLIAVLTRHLPAAYPAALEIVRDALLLDDADGAPLVSGFAAWPLIDWVGECGREHPELSLEALRRMTHRFSAEFAVRPFLLEHTDRTLETFHRWTHDPDPHVRRLVSEGTRPRLPWGRRLPMFMADPQPTLALLEKLKDDPEEYVRRSVANHLNDIAKDHPDLAADVGARWMAGASRDRQRLVKHGLRTLVKQGHEGALEALGYTTRPLVEVRFAIATKTVRLGESLELEAEIVSRARKPQKLVVDFAVHYRKASGSLAPKIFKWKVVDLPPTGRVRLRKKLAMVSRSVRRLYPGGHAVTVLVAGQEEGKRDFDLLP